MKKLSILLILTLAFAASLQAQKVEYTPDSLLKTNIIKMEFFSPLTGNLTLGYEKYLKNFTSLEAKIGIIGLGTQRIYDSKGIFIKAGAKFKLKPSYATEGTFGTHLLRGSYIRPELAYSYFERTAETDDVFLPRGESENVSAGAILLNYGKQHVLGASFTLDYYVGIGYGFSNSSEDGDYAYGFSVGSNDMPLAFATGFTIGVLLK